MDNKYVQNAYQGSTVLCLCSRSRGQHMPGKVWRWTCPGYVHSPVPPHFPSLPYPEAWRVKVRRKRPPRSAGQADRDVLQEVTLPGLSTSRFPAELGCCAAVLSTCRHHIRSSTDCALGYRLVSEEPRSNLCGLPKADTGPRFPKYMLITGPWSQQQWLGWRWAAHSVHHPPRPAPTVFNMARLGTLHRHTTSWAL